MHSVLKPIPIRSTVIHPVKKLLQRHKERPIAVCDLLGNDSSEIALGTKILPSSGVLCIVSL